MKIPKHVMVGPHKVPVHRFEIAPEHEVHGFFDNSELMPRIAVDSRIKGTLEAEVFIHETLHAIDEIFGIGLKHKQIHGLAAGLVQALKLK